MLATVYFSVFTQKFTVNAPLIIGGAMEQLGITNATYIADAIGITLTGPLSLLDQIPGIAGNATNFDVIVAAGQMAYAESYKYIYYASIPFGVLSIIAALFLGDIRRFMDDHVAVVYK